METLQWERVTPIFDTGESMQNNQTVLQMNFHEGTGKFFSQTEKKFTEYLDIIEDINRFDISKLDGIVEEWKEILIQYQTYTGMEPERIEKLAQGLQQRIEFVKQYKD